MVLCPWFGLLLLSSSDVSLVEWQMLKFVFSKKDIKLHTLKQPILVTPKL
jgi:hypothetical protein